MNLEKVSLVVASVLICIGVARNNAGLYFLGMVVTVAFGFSTLVCEVGNYLDRMDRKHNGEQEPS